MGSKSKYLIAMEITVRKDDSSMIDQNDSEAALTVPLSLEPH